MVRLCVPGAQKFEDSSPHLLGMTVFLRFWGEIISFYIEETQLHYGVVY